MQQAGGEWASGFSELSPSILEAIENKKFGLILTGDDVIAPSIQKIYFDSIDKNYNRRDSFGIPYLRPIDGAPLAPWRAWVRR
jgi:hypothetical protein